MRCIRNEENNFVLAQLQGFILLVVEITSTVNYAGDFLRGELPRTALLNGAGIYRRRKIAYWKAETLNVP